MAQVFTVTADTSVVSISTLQTPNTVVLLSSITYPGHIVGIRDVTGSPTIAAQPIIVSTILGQTFYDGTSSILINQPNGQVSVSSRNPTTWQVLNTVGFFTTLSNAFLEQLTATYGNFMTLSTVTGNISTLTASRVSVTNSILLLGNAEITGDIVVAGAFDIFSSLQSLGDIRTSSSLIVGGDVSVPSSLTVQGNLIAGRDVSTLQNLIVGQNLYVQSTLTTSGALVPRALSSQTLITGFLNDAGGFFGGANLSTQSNLVVGENLHVKNQGFINGDITTLDKTTILGDASFGGNLDTVSLQVAEKTNTLGSVVGNQNLNVEGYISSLGNVVVRENLYINQSTFTHDTIQVGSNGISVNGDVYIGTSVDLSVISTHTTAVGSNVALLGGLQTETTRVSKNLEVGQNFIVNTSLQANSNVSTLTNLGVGNDVVFLSTLFLNGTSEIQGNLTNLSSLYVPGNVSTSYMGVVGDLTVLGDYIEEKLAVAGILGAPLSLEISTLLLSNTLNIQSEGFAPFFQTTQFPNHLIAGLGNTITNPSTSLYLDGDMEVRNITGREPNNEFRIDQLNSGAIFNSNGVPYSLVGGDLGAIDQYAIFVPRPYLSRNLLLVGGTNAITVTGSIQYSLNRSNFYEGNSAIPSTLRILYNGSNLWMAAGQTYQTAASSIQYSTDGLNWMDPSGVGFSTTSALAFGSNRWVAGSYDYYGSNSTIQYSDDGSNWLYASGQRLLGGITDIATNGSNLWMATSSNSLFPVNRSVDGATWVQSIRPASLGGSTICYSVGYGGLTDPQYWLVSATNSNGVNIDIPYIFKSEDGSNWTVSGSPSSTPGPLTRLYWFNPYWFGVIQGPQFSSKIVYSSDGASWLPIADPSILSNTMRALAYQSNLLYALDESAYIYTMPFTSLSNWTRVGYANVLNSAWDLGFGEGTVPDPAPFFVFNIPSYFSSTVSSIFMDMSTIQASSFVGTLTGDGIGISNIQTFQSNVNVSTINTNRINIQEYATNIFEKGTAQGDIKASSLFIQNDLFTTQQEFLSTVNIWLAVGIDRNVNNTIQTSVNGQTWTSLDTPTFTVGATSVTGNLNLLNPIFVATGSDSRPNYTIQYSQNSSNWSPITSGGFATGAALAVAYRSNVWVVGGNDSEGTSTIRYSATSSVPIDWITVQNGFDGYCTYVTSGGDKFVALGYGDIYLKYAFISNPSVWYDSPAIPLNQFMCIGYGAFIDTVTGERVPTWLAETQGGYLYSAPPNDLSNWSLVSISAFGSNIMNTIFFDSDSGVWVAAGRALSGGGAIYRSLDGSNWVQSSNGNTATTVFSNVLQFARYVYYNSQQNIWVAGAQSQVRQETIWYSIDNAQNWFPSQSGGFSTSLIEVGTGYAALSFYDNDASNYKVLTAGKGAFITLEPIRPNIKQYFRDSYTTQDILTQDNASNVFSTVVRGLAYNSNEDYKLIAVGNGATPFRTIARAENYLGLPTFLPAITGGFKTTGYGVTYYTSSIYNNWIATGDAINSTNTIQYSPDGANWFGTNTSKVLREEGRGIAVGISTLNGDLTKRLVAVGKDIDYKGRIVTSEDSFNWFSSVTSTFMGSNGYGNGVTSGTFYSSGTSLYHPMFMAVGKSQFSTHTVLRSYDGSNWFPLSGAGGFSIQGNAVAWDPRQDAENYVVVGEDANYFNRIQYTNDGGNTWVQLGQEVMERAYGATFIPGTNSFVVVGEATAGIASNTVILFSNNPPNWTVSFGSSDSGFQPEISPGAAFGVFSQNILQRESLPIIDMNKLTIYNGTSALPYPNPTIRVQSTLVSFNELLNVNLSTQVLIDSNGPYQDSALTVQGLVYASSVIFNPSSNAKLAVNVMTSTLIVSSVYNRDLSVVNNVVTPYLGITIDSNYQTKIPTPNIIQFGQFNTVGFFDNTPQGTFITNVNETLFPGSERFPFVNGICTSTPSYSVDVEGSAVFSSLTTNIMKAPYINASTLQDFFVTSDNFQIFQGSSNLIPSGNTIFTEPSSIIFNSVLVLNISSQKVGCYTNTPQFDLDVRSQTYIEQLSTPSLNTGALFLRLYSV